MKKRIKREKRKEYMQIPKSGGQEGKARWGLEGGKEKKHTGNKKGEGWGRENKGPLSGPAPVQRNRSRNCSGRSPLTKRLLALTPPLPGPGERRLASAAMCLRALAGRSHGKLSVWGHPIKGGSEAANGGGEGSGEKERQRRGRLTPMTSCLL